MVVAKSAPEATRVSVRGGPGHEVRAAAPESWRTSQVFRPSTSALVELALRKAGLPGIGAKALSSISKTVIQKLVASLNET